MPQALAADTNLSLSDFATASASGQEVTGQWGPELVKDNNKGGDFATRDKGENFRNPNASRWSSPNMDEVWLQIDLGVKAAVNSVQVTWGKQFSQNFEVQVSSNGHDWNPVKTNLTGAASTEQMISLTTDGADVTAQSVRLVSHQRSDVWPIGIWEFEVFGTVLEELQPEPKLPALVPLPASYTAGAADEFFILNPKAELIAADNARDEVELFAQRLRAATGYELPIVSASNDDIADITFVNQAKTNRTAIAAEHYTLDVGAAGVQISGDTAHGLFNGVQTLAQLFGPWAQFNAATAGPWTIPALAIDDQPRFAHRGNMLDPARSFHTVSEMKQAIDIYSQYKFNALHVHLADDQGWRIEITNEGRKDGDTIDYTRLTDLSGKTAVGEGQGKFNHPAGKTGFYTQAEWKDLVAYANERHVTIIPEIDLPGHTNAALYAIPQLNTPGSSHDGTKNADGTLIDDPAQYITAPLQDTTAVGNTYLDFNSQATWNFIEHVVTQVVDITGSPYFHFGGDEAHDLTALDNGATYSKFVTKIANIVRAAGAIPVAWNEAMAGEQKPGDLIQLWQGNPSLTQQVVENEQAKLIYSFNQNLYYPQKPDVNVAGPDWACGGPCNMSWWYDYDPAARTGVSDADIYGIEAAQWNEHVRHIQEAFFIEFPRALAASEVGWTSQSLRNGGLNDFKARAAALVGSLTSQGVDFYHGDGLNPQPSIAEAIITKPAEKGTVAGYLFSPATHLDDVRSAIVTWDNGSATELTVSVDRPYQPGNTTNHENRAQNGIFTFALAGAAPQNAQKGIITVTVNGMELSSLGNLIIGEAEPTPPERVAVSALAPSESNLGSCTASPFVVIPDVVGVRYLVNETAVDGGTYSFDYGQTITISAVATDGYELTNPDWSAEYTGVELADLDCGTDAPEQDTHTPVADNGKQLPSADHATRPSEQTSNDHIAHTGARTAPIAAFALLLTALGTVAVTRQKRL